MAPSHITITIPVNEDTLTLIEELIQVGKGHEAEEKDVISASKLKEESEAPKKRGRKPKAAKAVEEDDEEETEEDADEETEEDADEEESDDEETEEDDEEESDDEDEGGTVTGSDLSKLKVALKVYSGKHGKDKTVKVLQKFAKASDKVKKADLPKLLKLLKV
jgi:hypothetical protein